MIEIRPAVKNDLSALSQIQAESWKRAFSHLLSEDTLGKYTDPNRWEALLEQVLTSAPDHFLIALKNGIPCASLFWSKENASSHTAEIISLHSLPESWGHGIGRALLETAVSDISKQHCHTITLWVFAQNTRARKFYEKNGFVPAGKSRLSSYDDAVEVNYTMKISSRSHA